MSLKFITNMHNQQVSNLTHYLLLRHSNKRKILNLNITSYKHNNISIIYSYGLFIRIKLSFNKVLLIIINCPTLYQDYTFREMPFVSVLDLCTQKNLTSFFLLKSRLEESNFDSEHGTFTIYHFQQIHRSNAQSKNEY